MLCKKKIRLCVLISAGGLLAAANLAVAADAYLEPYKVKYDADPLEMNQATITGNGSATGNTGTHVFIRDPGASITAHWPFPHGAGLRGAP